jgi:hypothetical protein
MFSLPVKPRRDSYCGSNAQRRRRAADFNDMAAKIANHVNAEIAKNPEEIQQYLFAMIANDLGLSENQVRSAIPSTGFNGATFRVSKEDRQALASYGAPICEKGSHDGT